MALADSVEDGAVMLADLLAGLIDDGTRRLRAKFVQQKVFDADFADEADALTVWLVGGSQTKLLGQFTDFGFIQLPYGHQRVTQRIFGDAVQEVGLVFGDINPR